MHLNRIAHRVGSLFAAYLLYSQSEDFQDICEENIVVNVSGNRGSSGWRSIFPIRYWYIDFEYAVRFPTGARFDDCRVKGLRSFRRGCLCTWHRILASILSNVLVGGSQLHHLLDRPPAKCWMLSTSIVRNSQVTWEPRSSPSL